MSRSLAGWLLVALLAACDEVPAARHEPQTAEEASDAVCGASGLPLKPPYRGVGRRIFASRPKARIAFADDGQVVSAGARYDGPEYFVEMRRWHPNGDVVAARRRRAGDAGWPLLVAREPDGWFRLLIRRPGPDGNAELLHARVGPECEESRWIVFEEPLDGERVVRAEALGPLTLLLLEDGRGRSLVAVDPLRGRVRAQGRVSDGHQAMTIGADATIALYNPEWRNNSVEIVDAATFALRHTIDGREGERVLFVVARPNGGYLLAIEQGIGTDESWLLRTHDEAGALVASVPLADRPSLGAPDGSGYALVQRVPGPTEFAVVRFDEALKRVRAGPIPVLARGWEMPVALEVAPGGRAAVLMEEIAFEDCCSGLDVRVIP